jgi:hypothetical protein
MGKRFIITEEEKSNILGLYGVQDVISEQKLNNDGTYTIQNSHKLRSNLDPNNKNFQLSIPAGTKAYVKDKIVYLGDTGHKLKCDFSGYKWIFHHSEGDTLEEYNDKHPLATVLRKLFCGKTTEPKTKVPKKVKLPNLTEKNFCNLSGDETWEYAKLDDGTWYTRKKGQEEWTKLELPKFQKAVDLLNKDAKCGSLEPVVIGTLPLKPIEQLPINSPTDIIKP